MTWFNSFQQRFGNAPRFVRTLHGSLSEPISHGFTLLINVVTLPLTLHYLRSLKYDIWVTVGTSVAMMAVLDSGIANTLTNFIAEAHADDDRHKAQLYFCHCFLGHDRHFAVADAAELCRVARGEIGTPISRR